MIRMRKPPRQYQPGTITTQEWDHLRASLALALEAVGNKPEDLTPDFLANCHMHLSSAFGIANRIAAERRATQGLDEDAKPATPADLIEVYLASVSAQLPPAALPWAVAPLNLALQQLRGPSRDASNHECNVLMS